MESTPSGNIHELEHIQRRTTKLIPLLQSLSYFERLQNLILPSLSYHHIRMDLIMIHKIINVTRFAKTRHNGA